MLVDRSWPRGIKKENAHVDLWMKDIAPSEALREWFGHKPERWTAFQRRYMAKEQNQAVLRLHMLKNKK